MISPLLVAGTWGADQLKWLHQGNFPAIITLFCCFVGTSMPRAIGRSQYWRARTILLEYLGETTMTTAKADAQLNNKYQQRSCKSKWKSTAVTETATTKMAAAAAALPLVNSFDLLFTPSLALLPWQALMPPSGSGSFKKSEVIALLEFHNNKVLVLLSISVSFLV